MGEMLNWKPFATIVAVGGLAAAVVSVTDVLQIISYQLHPDLRFDEDVCSVPDASDCSQGAFADFVMNNVGNSFDADFRVIELTITDDYFLCREAQADLKSYYSNDFSSDNSLVFFLSTNPSDDCALERTIVEIPDAVLVDSRGEQEVYRVKGSYLIRWTPVEGHGFYSLIKE